MRRPSLAWGAALAVALLLACGVPVRVAPTSLPAVTISAASSTPPAASPTASPAIAAAASASPAAPRPSPDPPPSTLHPPLLALPPGPTSLGRVENFVQVGHNALESRGWNAGLALNYPCAYVANRSLPQIAVVDVSDPASLALANELPLPPGRPAVELRAVHDLGLLVAMTFSPDLSLLTYDAADCLHPQPVGSLGLGAAPHEFFLWRDPQRPQRLLLYAALWGSASDLAVVDLTDPAAPALLATWRAGDEGAAGSLHSLTVSPDGQRAYLALWQGGFLAADSSDFALGLPAPRLRLVRDEAGFAPLPGLNTHSAVPLADPRYVLLTQEVYACPFAGLLVADVSAEARPQLAGRFDLPENDPACNALPQADAVFTAHNPLVVGDLVFVTWYGGGLQALDLSDPAQPRQVGMFVPNGQGAAPASYVGTYPVQMWSYPILREGLIYVSDIQSGLYALRYTGPGAETVGQVRLAEGNVSVLP